MQKKIFENKKTTIYEKVSQIVDLQTGEVVSQSTNALKITSSEPLFVKVYYQAMLAITDIKEIPVDFLLALSSYISFSDNKNAMFFCNNKLSRDYICGKCQIKQRMFLRYITRCIEKGILFKTDAKGIYEVNPWLIAKGKWENIRELQAKFEFIGGKWEKNIKFKFSAKNNCEN